jgi:SAM-dependent methyltransferase
VLDDSLRLSKRLLTELMAMSAEVKGTRGYRDNAAQHIERWESICFSELHADTIHLLPDSPADVLDIGAGSGRDAAALAALGYKVVAVEPLEAFRQAGAALHSSSAITWVDDSLPDLNVLHAMKASFDVIMLTAVWMHLDAVERACAMPILASLLRDGGVLLMTLRHGPVPAGRRMFDVPGEETVALAQMHALLLEHESVSASVQKANQETGIQWTHIAFRKGTPSSTITAPRVD